MAKLPKPPKAYDAFVKSFPKIAAGWDMLTAAGNEGPIDPKSIRLVKLAIAIGAMREGATRSGVRKAVAEGATAREIEQVIALAASTIGLPSAVAVYSWIQDLIPRR